MQQEQLIQLYSRTLTLMPSACQSLKTDITCHDTCPEYRNRVTITLPGFYCRLQVRLVHKPGMQSFTTEAHGNRFGVGNNESRKRTPTLDRCKHSAQIHPDPPTSIFSARYSKILFDQPWMQCKILVEYLAVAGERVKRGICAPVESQGR